MSLGITIRRIRNSSRSDDDPRTLSAEKVVFLTAHSEVAIFMQISDVVFPLSGMLNWIKCENEVKKNIEES